MLTRPATSSPRDPEEMVDHRFADTASPSGRCGVHRLQLRVLGVELLERADAEQVTVEAKAVEADGRVGQAVHVERVHVFRRAVLTGERQVGGEQLAHVGRTRVVTRDRAFHQWVSASAIAATASRP